MALRQLLHHNGNAWVLTYNKGRADAERVQSEIRKNGGKVDIKSLDILNLENIYVTDVSVPDQIYYFASPPIFVAKKGRFQQNIFDNFNRYYVEAINNLLMYYQPEKGKKLAVFYPSSVAVKDVPANMGEYTASKLAGETLCAFLQKNVKGLKFVVDRLPRLLTDQTATFFSVAASDPIPIMIKNIKSMCDIT